MGATDRTLACPECGSPYVPGVKFCAQCGIPLRSVDVDLGTLVGSYRLLELLGEGGMGRVYVAEHVKLGRRVAIKKLRSELVSNASAVARFFAEARAVNRISHENIVEITDFVEQPGGDNYIVMELLKGEDLGHRLQRKRVLPLPRAFDIAAQTASALAAVHAAGMIHRDLKPDNIFLIERAGSRDFVKVLDFGVAKLTDAAGVDRVAMHVTAAGQIIGTPEYMSPEQAGGMAIDARTDIYALGVILYEMITGALPFQARSFGELLIQHMTSPIELPGMSPGLPSDIQTARDQLLLDLLAKNPSSRPSSMTEVESRLRTLIDAMDLPQPPRKRTPGAVSESTPISLPRAGAPVPPSRSGGSAAAESAASRPKPPSRPGAGTGEAAPSLPSRPGARAGGGETTPIPPSRPGARAGGGETTPIPPSRPGAGAGGGETTSVPSSRAGVGGGETTPIPPSRRAGIGESTPISPPRANAGAGIGETTPISLPRANAGVGETTPLGLPRANAGAGAVARLALVKRSTSAVVEIANPRSVSRIEVPTPPSGRISASMAAQSLPEDPLPSRLPRASTDCPADGSSGDPDARFEPGGRSHPPAASPALAPAGWPRSPRASTSDIDTLPRGTQPSAGERGASAPPHDDAPVPPMGAAVPRRTRVIPAAEAPDATSDPAIALPDDRSGESTAGPGARPSRSSPGLATTSAAAGDAGQARSSAESAESVSGVIRRGPTSPLLTVRPSSPLIGAAATATPRKRRSRVLVLAVLAVVAGAALVVRELGGEPAPVQVGQVKIKFVSAPPGATVRLASTGETLGVTPFTQSFPRSERAAVFEFAMPGHVSVVESLALTVDDALAATLPLAPQQHEPPMPTTAAKPTSGSVEPAPPPAGTPPSATTATPPVAAPPGAGSARPDRPRRPPAKPAQPERPLDRNGTLDVFRGK